jgi:hypothetical protein
VKRTAQQRLAEMVDPALAALAQLVEEAESEMVQLAAIKDVLDRAGYKPKDRIEQTGRVQIEVIYDSTPALDEP